METLYVAVLHEAPGLDVHQVDFTLFYPQPNIRRELNSAVI